MKRLQNYFNADSIRSGAVSSQAAPFHWDFVKPLQQWGGFFL